MLIAYVDESGDTGDIATKGGASWTYTLGCVLIEAGTWPTAFDEMLTLRRNLRGTYGLQMRSEVKSNYLIRSSGPMRPLNLAPAERQLIFRSHLRIVQALPARAFAVVIDKRNGNHADVFDAAWETLMQRLERTSTKEQQPIMLMHDEGENDRVRAWVRRARRYLTAGGAFGGSFRHSIPLLVDDAVPRKSQHSYFIQLADLVAVRRVPSCGSTRQEPGTGVPVADVGRARRRHPYRRDGRETAIGAGCGLSTMRSARVSPGAESA